MPQDQIRTIVDEVATLIGPAVAHYVGQEFVGDHKSPPSMIWVPETGDCGAKTLGSVPKVGALQRTLHQEQLRVIVHVWGNDLHEAMQLRACLFTALRRVLQGSNYQPARTTYDKPAIGIKGQLLIVEVDLSIPVIEASLPYAPPGTDEGGELAAPLDTVQFDTTNAASGDGTLHAGES